MSFALVELIFVSSTVLALGFWELRNINRTLKETREKQKKTDQNS